MEAFGFLLLNLQVSCRNAKATVRIIIPDPFKQGLTSSQRNWNESMKDNRVANREWRDQQDRSSSDRKRITPSDSVLYQQRNSNREEHCHQHRIRPQPTRDPDQRADDYEIEQPSAFRGADQEIHS